MLKQRVITALCLAAVLFLILWSRSEWLFGLFLLVFFAAGAWENARLFDNRYPIAVAVLGKPDICIYRVVAVFHRLYLVCLRCRADLDRFAYPVAFPHDTAPAYLVGPYLSGLLPVFHSFQFPVRASPV